MPQPWTETATACLPNSQRGRGEAIRASSTGISNTSKGQAGLSFSRLPKISPEIKSVSWNLISLLQNYEQLSQTCWHLQYECWSNYRNCQLLAPCCNNKIMIYPGLFESTFHSRPSSSVLWTRAQAIYRKSFTHPWQAAAYGMNHWASSQLPSSGPSRSEHRANKDGTVLILSSLMLVFLHTYSGPTSKESSL